MAGASHPIKVLRVAVLVDDRVCDELHQTKPERVTVGTSTRNTLTVHDGIDERKSGRRRAPLWLSVGILSTAAGAGWFAKEVLRERALTAAARVEDPYAEPAPHEDSGAIGFLLALLGFVPLFVGLDKMRDPILPGRRRSSDLPKTHTLFDYRSGEYYLDLPAGARGKVTLGRKVYGVEQLRNKEKRPDGNVRIKLPPKAKGKLQFGDSTVLFQFAPPKPERAKPAFPYELRPRIEQFVSREDALSLASVAAVLGTYFTWAANATIDTSFSIDDIEDRFVQAMGIAPKPEEVPPEEEKEEVLAQEEKEDKKKEPEPEEKQLEKKPEKFSEEAMEKARGVGVARVLGTWADDGQGTIFDVMQQTENNLGELFAQGMTTTVLADGGDISPFVPGGTGISAHGAMVENAGLATGEGPAVGIDDDKRERKIRANVKSTSADVFGDVDKKAVQATIRNRINALRFCYEKALRSQPDLQGKMTFTISISVMGTVTSVVVEEDTLGNSGVTACATAKIKGWRFPMQGAEEAAEVTFPVVFSGAT